MPGSTKILFTFIALLGVILFPAQTFSQSPGPKKYSVKVQPKTDSLFPIDFHTFNKKVHRIVESNLEVISRGKALISAVSNKPVVIQSGNFTYDFQLVPTKALSPSLEVVNLLDARSEWTIAGIPARMSFSFQSTSFDGKSISFASVKYRRPEFVRELGARIFKDLKPGDLLAGLEDPLSDLKRKAQSLLERELSSLNEECGHSLSEDLKILPDVEKLMKMDLATLRGKFINANKVSELGQNEEKLARLVSIRNLGGAFDSTTIHGLEAEIRKGRGMLKLIEKIEKHKESWRNSGLISKILEWDLFRTQKLQEILQDPSTVLKLAGKNATLSNLQKTFLKINKLDLGQGTVNTGDLGLKSFLSKGSFADLLNNNKYFMFFHGKFGDLNSIRDLVFETDPFSAAGTAKALQFGKGKSENSYSRVSVMSFDQSFGNSATGSLPTMWRSLVTTVSRESSVGAYGKLSTEFSKSATTFISQRVEGSSTGSLQKLLGGDLLANTAVTLDYDNEHPGIGLTYQLTVKAVSRGYDNPGNSFLTGGAKEGAVRVKKLFFKEKLSLSWNGQLRQFDYSGDERGKWQNTYMVATARWKMKRGQFFQLRYTPVRMHRVGDILIKPMITDRLAAEANFSNRIGGNFLRNYINISHQRSKQWLGLEAGKNSSISVSLYQSMNIGKNLIYINSVYSSSDYSWYANMFSRTLFSEAGFTFLAGKNISASTAAGYLDVYGVQTKLSLRQTLSGSAGRRFRFDLFVDAGVNLKRSIYSNYDDARVDLSINYQILK